MNIEDIRKGELDNVEYKLDIPEEKEKYLKTAVAFANGAGGQIIFGIKNHTWDIIGFTNDIVFEKMDAITNSIYDSCSPRIIPDATIQEINGKYIIIIKIYPGPQKPYYLSKQGINNGTYIRVSGVTRKAEADTIQELYYEGLNQSFDQLPTQDEVSLDRATQLCERMNKQALSHNQSDASSALVHNMTLNQLLSWKLLIRKDKKYYATHAFHLLEGNHESFPFATIQCAVFKGTTRSIFLNRQEISGPIDQQIDQATHFVMQNIRLGSRIDNVFRKDFYELPITSIREMIANAVCHRSYIIKAKIQVALFDDRLEVTSPGRIDSELTFEDLKNGYSKIRNYAITSAFAYMHIIESWGTGIPRIFEEAQKYGLPDPQMDSVGNAFRITLYRKPFETDEFGVIDPRGQIYLKDSNTSSKQSHKDLTSKEKELLATIRKNPHYSQSEFANQLNWTISSVKYYLKKLQEKQLIQHTGTNRKGEWIIVDKEINNS